MAEQEGETSLAVGLGVRLPRNAAGATWALQLGSQADMMRDRVRLYRLACNKLAESFVREAGR